MGGKPQSIESKLPKTQDFDWEPLVNNSKTAENVNPKSKSNQKEFGGWGLSIDKWKIEEIKLMEKEVINYSASFLVQVYFFLRFLVQISTFLSDGS